MANEQDYSNTATDQKLLERGYHEFPPGPFDNADVVRCFQKRFDDENGKKYFITVRKWKSLRHPHTGEVFPPSYESEVQLCTKDKDDALNLVFLSSWSIEDVEHHVETLFQTGLYRYYELWDGTRGMDN